ncbi:hypothetical protein A2U01_0001931 [Trifolium medium]|uniref:Uncharacterized protein n=1 Tax=Trifolium medium TaxID=97028 RepID=A0A392M1G6_9FABA|nr:hypothetical protein [Trifolium medium]
MFCTRTVLIAAATSLDRPGNPDLCSVNVFQLFDLAGGAKVDDIDGGELELNNICLRHHTNGIYCQGLSHRTHYSGGRSQRWWSGVLAWTTAIVAENCKFM